jgi:hypothetical protein
MVGHFVPTGKRRNVWRLLVRKSAGMTPLQEQGRIIIQQMLNK